MPFDDANELFGNEDSNFYQFKMENKCMPVQQDNHNCSLAASLATIRICQALENERRNEFYFTLQPENLAKEGSAGSFYVH